MLVKEIYVIKNKVSKQVYLPFFADTCEQAKEFCLKSIIDDSTNTLARMSHLLDCYWLGVYDPSAQCELCSDDDICQVGCIVPCHSCSPSFNLGDIVDNYKIEIPKLKDVNFYKEEDFTDVQNKE